MAPEQKRSWVCVSIVILFILLLILLLRTEGSRLFYPEDAEGTAWITILSAATVLSLAIHLILFRSSFRLADVLGDEREQNIANQAGLLARTLVLMVVFGTGILAQSASAGHATLEIPRLAIGFGLASLLALYLGIRAVCILVLYGRGG